VTTKLYARAATPYDYTRFLRMFAELGVDDAPPTRTHWERAYMPATLFFEQAGAVTAYAFCEALADTGYVRHLVVERHARGRGVGGAVMRELKRRFAAFGCRQLCLNVQPNNAAAIRVYEAAGLRAAYRSASFRIAWSSVASLPAPRPEHLAQILQPEEDAQVERRFELQRGMVHSRREREDMVLLVLRAGDDPEPLGLACFDPHFPGASPFCAHDAAAARALLEALRPLARPHADIQLVVENHPALCRAIEDAGGQVRLQFLHYRGPL
jgi:GNAT superfamily N-acetyltransferase